MSFNRLFSSISKLAFFSISLNLINFYEKVLFYSRNENCDYFNEEFYAKSFEKISPLE